ncbi:class I adenylate-forming enzyme family protein [Alkalihalobacterium elongatum]|uniref:class I adenylate-forming enzyme family protein n=1 Tax=Alkalihalobacterium elongatum TaxID=2675466 RepID=UPI001C1F6F9A|nr:AMP-binding protein [Alkalihalobacterium elongatum]
MKDWIVHQALTKAVEKCPDKPFLLLNDRSVTYRELDEISDRLATALLNEGFKKGDNIAILALNQFEWLYTYFATAKIGVGLVALNVRYRESEFEYMLNNANVKGIVSISNLQGFDYANFFNNFKEKVPTVEKYIFIGDGCFDGSLSFEELMSVPINWQLVDRSKQNITDEDTVVIIYTSGTTGRPKGTMITNRSILEAAQAQVDHLSLNEDDCMIGNLPLNHVGGITCTIHTTLLSFGSVVLIPLFIPEMVLQAIHQYKPTIFGGVPTMYVMLCNNKEITNFDLSSIKYGIVGGSNVDPDLCEEIKIHFSQAQLINLYGLSETSGACILSKLTDSMEKVQQSIGVPIGDFKVKVIDNEGNDLPAGEVGELLIKGNSTAKGYFGLEEETKKAFSDDSWLSTGDVGYVDDEGYIYFKGRKKEMYIQGGYNVYPVEVENIISSHPKVSVVAGIGVPDTFLGEVGRYYIIPKQGTNIREEEIIEYCKQYLADYKVPKQIVFEKELPLTPAGKVQKSILKSLYLENSTN